MQIYIFDIKYTILCPHKQRTVSVAQKPEITRKSIVVNILPITSNEGRNQQKQRALWLMEVCNQHIHNSETVTWNYNDLRT